MATGSAKNSIDTVVLMSAIENMVHDTIDGAWTLADSGHELLQITTSMTAETHAMATPSDIKQNTFRFTFFDTTSTAAKTQASAILTGISTAIAAGNLPNIDELRATAVVRLTYTP